MTSTKIQINHNNRNLNIQNCFEHLNIDIWNLFVIWRVILRIVEFLDIHQIDKKVNHANKN